MPDTFYTNFGVKNAIIKTTNQTDLQRNAFLNSNNSGRALGANTTASSLFSIIGETDNTATLIDDIQNSIIDNFITYTIPASLNPDFTSETKINFSSLDNSTIHLLSLNDKPNQFGPNIGTLGIDSSGLPETIDNRPIKNSPTHDQGKGFGFTVDSNKFGSHINYVGNTTFGNYLSRKYDNSGNLLIKKGESIDHDNLNYEN